MTWFTSCRRSQKVKGWPNRIYLQSPDVSLPLLILYSSHRYLELFSQEYNEQGLRLKAVNPPLIQELYELYSALERKNAREYLHDALDHMESLLTLFDLGYIDLGRPIQYRDTGQPYYQKIDLTLTEK